MPRLPIGFLLVASAFAQSPVDGIKLNDLGNQASEQGDYVKAASHYREAVEIWRSNGSAYDAHLAGTLMNLGTVLCAAGRRTEGAAAFEEALAMHRRTLGARHARTISNMNLLATDYLMLGQLEKAETLLNEVLPITRADFPEDIQTARSLEILSGVLNRHGKLKEAIEPAEEALAIITRISGEGSLEAALAYASTAEAHRAVGQTARALPLYRKAQALYEKSLGPYHPRVASVISQQGLIFMQDGKLATAEQLMVQAVDILAQHCSECLVERAVAANNLGLLRLKQKRYRDADATLSEALTLREKFSPRPTPELAASMQSLAIARKMQHRDADAASLNKRAAAIMAFQ